MAPTTTFEKSLSYALASKKNPYIISDMGDNPTAGGAGDVTWDLEGNTGAPRPQVSRRTRTLYTLRYPDLNS